MSGDMYYLSQEYVRMLGRISINPKVYGGELYIKGMRIPIYIILNLLKEGYTFERIILDCYPQITKEDIKAVLEYSSVTRNHIKGSKM